MTENESRMLFGSSPSETALRLYTNLGPDQATAFVESCIKLLARRAPLPVRQLAFLTDVSLRLSGFRPAQEKETQP